MPSPVSRRSSLHPPPLLHCDMIRGPSTSDDLSLSSSSSSSVDSWGFDDLPSAAVEENKNNNADCRYQQYHIVSYARMPPRTMPVALVKVASTGTLHLQNWMRKNGRICMISKRLRDDMTSNGRSISVGTRDRQQMRWYIGGRGNGGSNGSRTYRFVRVGTRLFVGWGKYNIQPYIFVSVLFIYAIAIIDQRTQLNNSPDIALTGIDHGQLCSTTHKTREEEKGLWGNCKRFICTQQSTSVNRRAFVSYPESASPRAVDSGSWIELI
jgi:hypothetical protein